MKHLLQGSIICLSIFVCAVSSTAENLNLKTYYPSPYGVYEYLTITQDLLLKPYNIPPPCNGSATGSLYVDAATSDLRFCDGSEWQVVGGIWWYDLGTNEAYLNDWSSVNGIGIGMSDPAVMLELPQNEAIKVGNAYLSSGGNMLRIANNAWWNGSAWTITGDGAMIDLMANQETRFYRQSGGTFLRTMTIDASGNVGIGTTNITERLTVNGRIYVQNDPTANQHASTKNYSDRTPVMQTRSVSSAGCSYGGHDGTDLRVRHAGCPAGTPSCWTSYERVSEVSCYPVEPPKWQCTSWSSCSTCCGSGTQTRTCNCVRYDGVILPDSYCGGGGPPETRNCNNNSCCP